VRRVRRGAYNGAHTPQIERKAGPAPVFFCLPMLLRFDGAMRNRIREKFTTAHHRRKLAAEYFERFPTAT
jgi:hypothetical protein